MPYQPFLVIQSQIYFLQINRVYDISTFVCYLMPNLFFFLQINSTQFNYRIISISSNSVKSISYNSNNLKAVGSNVQCSLIQTVMHSKFELGHNSGEDSEKTFVIWKVKAQLITKK